MKYRVVGERSLAIEFQFRRIFGRCRLSGRATPSPALKRSRMIAGWVFSKAPAEPEKKRGSLLLFKVGQLRLKGANSERKVG
jgi:hypothetical protein